MRAGGGAERRRPADLLAGQRHGDFGWTFERDGWRLGIQGLNTVERNCRSARVEPVTRTRVDAISGGSIDRWRRKHDAKLLLTHHGADWLKATMLAGYPDELLKCDVHLAGHQHSPGLSALSVSNAGRYGVELQAPALALEGAGMLQRAGYQAGRILWNAVEGSRLRVWPRQYALNRSDAWRFIADHDGYNLDADQGTFPAQLERPTRGGSHADVTLAKAVVDAMPQPPVLANKPGTPVYLSYAWGDQTNPGALREEAADAIYAWLMRAGYDARRDRRDLGSGDSISSYERQIGTAQHVIVVLSDKYLRSPYCMAELHNIHEHCLRDPVTFLQRVTCVLLEDAAGIRDDLERLRYAREWKARYHAMHVQLSAPGIEAIGLRTFERFHKICDFWRKTDTILGYIADQLNPTGLADIQFNDFEVLKRQLPKQRG